MSCWQGLCKTVRETGYLCNSNNKLLIMEINNDFVVVRFNEKTANASLYEYSTDLNTISSQCEEIEVKIDVLYHAVYEPRVYYTVYIIKTSNNMEFHLLEQLDVSFFFILNFYPCNDLSECKKKIEEIQESLTYSAKNKIKEAHVRQN